MRNVPLGATDETITDYCLGTMTWGNQTPEDQAHRQMDMALEAGIDVIDTAEMYPVNPVKAETVGNTERVIGNWNAAHPARRGDYKLATKISGENGGFVRPGQPITGATFAEALEGSLERLRTDYIDIYQLHWPNRGSYMFRQNWTYVPKGDRAEILDNMRDVLDAAGAAQKAGKIRHFALSNESAWGTAQWLRLSEELDLPRVQTVQNEYSLMCRLYDTDMAELSVHERVTLLAFSPLATGLLTGKYQGGRIPEDSRMSLSPEMGGRRTPRAFEAVDAYLGVAEKHGLDPVHMAMAFTVQRPFAVSSIFGATTCAQLQHILDGKDLVLSNAVLEDIDAAHRAHPMPY
ncbi:aldo/keto reductase [Hasllibacter sp. MH4015]|uniref:aldo/keto reductase n=1 Tax=Hasllibacter sp. MH4015 TaxID=2854029 RepID=UPI001CD62ABD|nr:aldo/keto reductase [Hasllibacter sp. MH4015]